MATRSSNCGREAPQAHPVPASKGTHAHQLLQHGDSCRGATPYMLQLSPKILRLLFRLLGRLGSLLLTFKGFLQPPVCCLGSILCGCNTLLQAVLPLNE